MMDEISTGLDSATTYSVTQTFLDVAHSLRRTIVISLLQPPPEVFHLFDDVLLLTDGLVVYHGPVKEVIPFFRSLGFIMPERKDPASFLQVGAQAACMRLKISSRSWVDVGAVPNAPAGGDYSSGAAHIRHRRAPGRGRHRCRARQAAADRPLR